MAETGFSTEQLVTIAGGVLLAIAAFLPWASASISLGPFGEVGGAITGIDDDIGFITLAAGVAAAALAAFSEWEESTIVAALAAGAVGAVLGLYKFVDYPGAATIEIGLYLTIVGGIVAAAGAGLAYRDRNQSGSAL